MCWLSLASPEDQAITHHSLTLLVRSNTFPSRLSNATTGAADLDDTGLGITSRPGCFGFPMGIFLHLPVRVLFVPSCLFLVLILIVTFMLVDLTLTRRSRSGIIISDCFTIVYPKFCNVRRSGRVNHCKRASQPPIYPLLQFLCCLPDVERRLPPTFSEISEYSGHFVQNWDVLAGVCGSMIVVSGMTDSKVSESKWWAGI